MKSQYLIVGATGAIGYAFTKALIDSGKPVTLLVRDKSAATKLFGTGHLVDMVEGDVYDTQLLKSLSRGKRFIFHGANVSYEQWAEKMPAMTNSIIEAAEATGATVIFPGNNYNFGSLESPISELTPFNPCSEMGSVRVQLEKTLQQLSQQGRIKVLVVRLAELWGPNVTNKMFAPIFDNVQRGKSMPWLITAKVPQQLLFNLDAGRAILELTQRDSQKPYEVINIGGELVPSIEQWLGTIASVARQPCKISVVPRAVFNTLAAFSSTMKPIKSLLYKQEKTILLDDRKFRKTCPDFESTPMQEAIAQTLKWFHDNGRFSEAAQTKRQMKRKKLLRTLVIDNAAIGIFPFFIALLVSQLAFLNNLTVVLGVVAGIYWTPALHALASKVFPQHQSGQNMNALVDNTGT